MDGLRGVGLRLFIATATSTPHSESLARLAENAHEPPEVLAYKERKDQDA